MKKLLIVILFAFIIISIFSVMLTIQMSKTFRDFIDENENEDEDENENDSYNNSNFEIYYKSIPQEKIMIQTFEDIEDKILIIKELKQIKR